MGALPEELKTIISQEDFSAILSYAIIHLSNIKRGDIQLIDGILMYEVAGGQQVQTNFINLIKNVLRAKNLTGNREQWISWTRPAKT